ncbi:shikimate kinase [Marivirga salinae]|uniref:Shikimate kinase n=1 Tax=Marivirga salinarum TaxID=3059078 RepID=A0AA49GAK0_9BACT|nr:shikimate kinase [Marivirga sp. BDSF4-3]WKK75000.2 shikimate kinase [Marivirga sp. BDSF4-3]
MRYFLLGLPGSGKSYWGKLWAENIKVLYFDLDEVIETNEGFSINEIFQNEGEEHFRNLETFYLNKLIDNYEGFILSTGGGTPCFNNNIKLMNEEGVSIFLNPPIKETAKRIWKPNGGNKRPMFSECNSLNDVELILNRLYKKRLPFYQEANKELNKWDENSLKGLK